MLVFGLVAGPLLGLLGGHVMKRFSRTEQLWGAVLLLVACLVGVTVLHISAESKVGVVTGVSLGFLLSGTNTEREAEMGHSTEHQI